MYFCALILFRMTSVKNVFLILSVMLLSGVVAYAQPVTLTFTGRDILDQYFPLNRVVVTNVTKGWQETLIWPDTVLVMTPTGIENMEARYTSSLQLSQNNPNPFEGTTYVNLQVTEPGDVTVEITDITGRIVGTYNYSSLQPGIHEMCVFLSSPGLYFLTVQQNGQAASVKMMNRGNGGENGLVFTGMKHVLSLKQIINAGRGVTDIPFDIGDLMEYVGFASFNGEEVESAHYTQEVYLSQTVTLTFPVSLSGPDGEPCPNNSTVTDFDGNVYNTVQIGTQCWMRENLRVTHFPDGTAIPAGGDFTSNTAPYYYDNTSSIIPLEERGYWYNWPASQGACPEGWHLPSDEEWTELTDYMSSKIEYNCNEVPDMIAKALASEFHWVTAYGECFPGDLTVYTNNASGFSVVPAGESTESWSDGEGIYSMFWSSLEQYTTSAWVRILFNSGSGVFRDYSVKLSTHSVRCLRD